MSEIPNNSGEEKPELPSVKSRLSEGLEERLPKVFKAIDDGLQVTKTVSVTCPGCGRRHQAEVQDVKGALAAAEYLTQYGFGRPGAPETADQERIVFRRITVDSTDDIEAAVEADQEAYERETREKGSS